MKKSANIKLKLYSPLLVIVLLFAWQLVSDSGLVPAFMLPSPSDVVRAFVGDLSNLIANLWITLGEAALGLALGVCLGFAFALLMDRFNALREALYPLLVLTQTVPTGPLPAARALMGYGIAPKVVLILIVTFSRSRRIFWKVFVKPMPMRFDC